MGICNTKRNGKLHSYDDKPVNKIGFDKYWYEDGIPHRVNGPAKIIWDVEYYYYNGKYYRENGPSIVMPDGSEYYIDGNQFKRDDGPAATVIIANTCYNRLKQPLNDRIFRHSPKLYEVMSKLKLISKPYEMLPGEYVVKYWFKNNRIHRDNDLPAIESDLCNIWVINGEIHRKNEPAIIYSNNACEFWENNQQVNLISRYTPLTTKSARNFIPLNEN